KTLRASAPELTSPEKRCERLWLERLPGGSLRAGETRCKAGRQTAQPRGEVELKHRLGVALVLDEGVGAVMADLDPHTVHPQRSGAVEDPPHTAGLVRPAVGALLVGCLRDERHAGRI